MFGSLQPLASAHGALQPPIPAPVHGYLQPPIPAPAHGAFQPPIPAPAHGALQPPGPGHATLQPPVLGHGTLQPLVPGHGTLQPPVPALGMLPPQAPELGPLASQVQGLGALLPPGPALEPLQPTGPALGPLTSQILELEAFLPIDPALGTLQPPVPMQAGGETGEGQPGGDAEQTSQAPAAPSHEQPALDGKLPIETIEATLLPAPVHGGVEIKDERVGSNEELKAKPMKLTPGAPDGGLPSEALDPEGTSMFPPFHPIPSMPRLIGEWNS